MPNPTAAILVIGDEILSGRTRDANMHHLANALTEVGIDLKEARFVSDDNQAIVDAIRALSKSYDHVFSSGGIGPTHDDITADAIAKAFHKRIDVRKDALKILREHYDRQGVELNEARLRMARIPDGAKLIDNPVSSAPGFRLKNVNVMAGVPSIFQAMLQSVLPSLVGGMPVQSETVRINRGEGDIAADLGVLAQTYPDVTMGSYPFLKDDVHGTNLVLRSSDKDRLAAAKADLIERVQHVA